MHEGVVWLVMTLTIFTGLSSCDSNNLLANRLYCGLQHTDDYARDNDKISLDEFPWIAQILFDEDKSVKCVGSLINSRYVLTAGHCFVARDTQITGVRFGDYNISTDRDCTNHTKFGEECSDPVQEFDIQELTLHPQFNPRTSVNDIGLIRLAKNVDYSDYVRPICLPSADLLELKDGEELAISGWGVVAVGGKQTEIKKKILGNLISLDKCLSIYSKKTSKIINNNHLCVIENRESFTCQGDSGGPLMKRFRNQWYQVGIVLYGRGCGNELPTVYTKVSSYLEWIEQSLRK